MRFPRVILALTVVELCEPAGARAQDSAQMVAQQAELRALIEHISRDRPPQAELAARQLLAQLQIAQSSLDSLLARSPAEYWSEVAQLTVQQQMLNQALIDASRHELMMQMFGTEARARALQRDARDRARQTPDSTYLHNIRERLEDLMTRHFAAEDSLRRLEIADGERRLAQIRADTERRRRERPEIVRRQVDEILRDALRQQ